MAASIFKAPAQGLLSKAARKVFIPRAQLFNADNCSLFFLPTRFQPPTMELNFMCGWSTASDSHCWLRLPLLNGIIKEQRQRHVARTAGICCATHAIKGEDDALFKGVKDKSVKHILEMAARVSTRKEILQTDFLTPPTVKEAMFVLEKLADVKAVALGGYPEAERCRIVVGHAEAMETIPDAVAALSITGNFGFQPCSHGDFLGSIIGTGISRESIGDILLQEEKGAQVIVVPELVDFLITSLTKVGNISVSCSKIPLLALEYEPPRTKSFNTIEASLRVDALASAGFKISRSKLVDLISNGDVRVNWSPVTKNGTTLKSGDVVSVSGKGRLKIGEINTTKKGKYAVELIRYL